MEESSNGKMEETRKAQSPQEDEEVVVKEVEEMIEPEPEPESGKVVDDKEIIVGNDLGKENDVRVEEKVVEVNDEKEESTVSDVTVEEELSETVTETASGIADVVTKELEEKSILFPSLETADANGTRPVAVDAAVDVAEAVAASTDVEKLAVAEEPKEIHHQEEEPTTLEESSRDVSKQPEERHEELAKESANVSVVESNDAAAVTTPIISVSQRTMQATSWRSCCGLFDVLRRSNR